MSLLPPSPSPTCVQSSPVCAATPGLSGRHAADPRHCALSVLLDVAELEKKLKADAGRLTPAAAPAVEKALGRYQGDFLAGFCLPNAPGFDQ